MAAGATRARAHVLARIAMRNLVASRGKTLIIGGIILLGTVLVVVGSSLLDSVDRGMRSSIQGSLGGHLQVYDARSKDELALYGGMMGDSDVEPMEDFAQVKRALATVPNVKTIVPMGIGQAMVVTGNPMDVALEKLRADVRRLEAGDRGADLARAYDAHRAHVRRMVRLLREDFQKARAIVSEARLKERARDDEDLDRAAADAFWEGFDRDRLGALEFLENRIAPQSTDQGFTFVRYVGTDLDLFTRAFDRTEIVEGTAVPKGERGILLGKWYAEEYLKMRAAHRLDQLRDARVIHRRRIAKDEELQRWVKEGAAETKDILVQLDPLQAEEATRRLQRALGSGEPDLAKLLQQLMTVDDASFDRHYRIFYDELAPLVRLYLIRPGDVITIKAPARSGYMNSVNVKVYGFVQFRGLEKSRIAGVMSLMDLVTFRDLYGYMTPEKREEIARLKTGAAAKIVERDRAEAELFGAAPADPAAANASATSLDDAKLLADVAGASRRKLDQGRVFGQDEIDSGVALNAALLLKDPSRLAETQRAVQAAANAAGLKLRVVDWQKASGLVGQFVTLARLILWVAVLIIFAVALVIINNAMVMATLQRVKEIGTMRAIGAQRRFVLMLLLAETIATGVVFGLLGAAVGAGVVRLLRATGGIPATNDQLYFFFSGPSLLPTVGTVGLVASFAIVLVVSVASGFYPALIAMRVTPVEAMAADD
jgi:ABC-type lipoprotein release transport system permease subunit